MTKKFQAVFIDRDGTLGGSDRVVYPGEFELFPGVAQSLQRLRDRGILICSFTNQPGISAGEATAQSFQDELKAFGFDGIYLCPHAHGAGCECRKPSAGMLFKAADDLGLDLGKCAVIGDRWTDLLAAEEAGCIKILVKTGSGKQAYEKYISGEYIGRWAAVRPDFAADDFNEAVDWLITRIID